MCNRDKFDKAASFLVEEHIRIHDQMVPHPDKIKDAIAKELRDTWNEAIHASIARANSILVYANRR